MSLEPPTAVASASATTAAPTTTTEAAAAAATTTATEAATTTTAAATASREEDDDAVEEADGEGAGSTTEDDDGKPLRFAKYSSLENHYVERTIDELRLLCLAGEPAMAEWVATEKVHGANLQFLTDGSEVLVAKRTALIRADEAFFGYQRVLERYRERVLQLFRRMKAADPPLQSIAVYGELFGGAYHNMPAVPGVSLVQREILYCPDLEFYAFDICVRAHGTATSHQPGASVSDPAMRSAWRPSRAHAVGYLDYDRASALFRETGFFYAEALRRGTFLECLAYDVDSMLTTIPARLGLPPADSLNISEGVVIRPAGDAHLSVRGLDRPVVKKKRREFSERGRPMDPAALAKLQAMRQAAKKSAADGAAQPDLSPAEIEIRTYLKQLVNRNRLIATISKTGSPTRATLPRLAGLLAADAIAELRTEPLYGDAMASLTPEERKRIGRAASSLALDYVNENAEALVTGKF